MQKRIIALMTDFGCDSHFVGIMKGVISCIDPNAVIIDLCHDLQPQNIKQAAFVLRSSYKYFPKGTVFCCVVDPGVGSKRDQVAIIGRDHSFVAPDNGILTYILPEIGAVEALKPAEKYFLDDISNTFHGRDIFSPVSAYLSKEGKIEGEKVSQDDLVMLPALKEEISDNKIAGEIIYPDTFGNLISSISKETIKKVIEQKDILKNDLFIQIGDIRIEGISRTFSDVDEGGYVAYIGSAGYLEMGIRNGSAAGELGFSGKMNVQVIWRGL